jgi:hypothetical protein
MEDLLELARALPDGGDITRFLEALAAADDERYDELLDALDRSRADAIVALVMTRLPEASAEARVGAAELFDNLEVPIKACLTGENLDVMLAFDLPGGVMFVPQGWGDEQTFLGALARVRSEPGLTLDRHEVQIGKAIAPLFVLHGPSFFTATHALWADEFDPPAAPYGTLIAVPTHNAVLAHPIRDARVLSVIEPLQELARAAAEQGGEPVSTRLFWLRNGRLEAVDATPEFEELLERLSN